MFKVFYIAIVAVIVIGPIVLMINAFKSGKQITTTPVEMVDGRVIYVMRSR